MDKVQNEIDSGQQEMPEEYLNTLPGPHRVQNDGMVSVEGYPENRTLMYLTREAEADERDPNSGCGSFRFCCPGQYDQNPTMYHGTTASCREFQPNPYMMNPTPGLNSVACSWTPEGALHYGMMSVSKLYLKPFTHAYLFKKITI